MIHSNLFKLVCKGSSNVLITGPTGTGKSHLARRIHESSSRAGRPFVVVNLATLHEGTFESELFGHERGAFTGADQRRIGKLELAQGGTVFLDEIGELSHKLQARLLEFLQSRIIVPLGGNRELKLDVRVIAATHRNLRESVSKKEFREDLFHRLRLLTLNLLPLRERAEEFDELVHSTLEEFCLQSDKRILRISESVTELLESHDWPGNIRELRSVLEYAVQSCEGVEIEIQDLPPWFREDFGVQGFVEGVHSLGVAEIPLELDFHASLEIFEREYLKRALARYQGRVNLTARKTGMSKTTLIQRIQTYGLRSNRPLLGQMESQEARP